MKQITHSLTFVTELDETNPTAMRLLQLEESAQVLFLESMLRDLLVPVITPAIDELNLGNSWATLKVAK